MIKKAGGNIFKILTNALICFFSLTCIFPIVWMFISALKTNSEFMSSSLSLPANPNFGNFLKALQAGGFLRSFANSAILAGINVVLTVICSFVVAYFLSRYKFFLRNFIYLLFVAGMVIPTLSLMIPVFVEFKILNLLNKPYTLIMPYLAFAMPFSVIVVENYIASIPREMDEAAYMEGCTTFQLLRKIIFPMCSPILAIVVITSFINAWNEFPFSLVLVNDESLRTISLAIRMFNSEHTINYPLYIGALLISILPILIIYSFFSKKVMEGMTMGAVKG
ncbi:MAG: carbohydrate ABC transporter permease [Lachnospiraceae bacterium]|nr:carbohydrate ABC transporter permease [Lachnospiraceae bacterium]